MKSLSFVLALSLAVLSGCGSSDAEPVADETGDARDARFADGKADAFGITEGSATAAAIIEVANTATLATLDDAVALGGVGLDRRAAEGIVAQRPFSTLADLDAVPYVGPVALELLYSYALAAGMVNTTVSCSYDNGWLYDSSTQMNDTVLETLEVDRTSPLTVLQKSQLRLAVVHLGFLQADDGVDAVWDASDEGTFEFRFMAQADWIRFYAGDTETGVVFEAGTTNIVAEVSDGDILGCGTGAQVPTEITCSYTHSWEFGMSSDMLNNAASTTVLTPTSELTSLQQDQLRTTATFLEFIGQGDDFSAVWNASDDRSFDLIAVDGQEDYDWVRFYAGDTETGVVFKTQSTTIVAQVSDGDVLFCQ